jgi:hypothetical protein
MPVAVIVFAATLLGAARILPHFQKEAMANRHGKPTRWRRAQSAIVSFWTPPFAGAASKSKILGNSKARNEVHGG